MCKSKFVTVNKCLGQNGESTSKIIAKKKTEFLNICFQAQR
jgi:hypothetical protein